MNTEYNIEKKDYKMNLEIFFNEIFINQISTQKDLKNFYLNDLPQINDSYIDLINKFLY